jgi:hypothetical protein
MFFVFLQHKDVKRAGIQKGAFNQWGVWVNGNGFEIEACLPAVLFNGNIP